MENNMKQFNLQEYLANPSRQVVTRDGRKVTRFLCTDAKTKFPIIALVEVSPGSTDEKLRTYNKDGRFFIDDISPNDLFFLLDKHEGWINLPAVLPEEQGDLPHPFKIPVFETEAKAREARDNVERCLIKIEDNAHYYSVKIEWEE